LLMLLGKEMEIFLVPSYLVGMHWVSSELSWCRGTSLHELKKHIQLGEDDESWIWHLLLPFFSYF
jgi:hypothetical protein